ncbi:MAG: NUDIX domain-containing protein [Draconibacterium sp.]|nr:NUDIX domain-containing protein [Draconibacterium sp.]
MKLYSNHPKHFVAVDCVIFGYRNEELCLLLYPRGFEPSQGKWSLMGGFIQKNESSEEAAKRVLNQTTGLKNIYLEQIETFTQPNRDPEARVISIGYYALSRMDEYDEKTVREHGAHWWPITELPQMIFDHANMVEKALIKLQQKSGYSIVGKELLPEKFTLMQLRKLYEAIFQREFDPGNFRKKILSLDTLQRLNTKNYSESKKGAFYYKCQNSKSEKILERIVKI